MRGILLLLLCGAAALGLASCSTPTPAVAESAPTPPHAYGIEQRTLGEKTQFVACADCERPTPKTLRAAAPRLATAAAASPASIASVSNAAKDSQPVATRTPAPPVGSTRTEVFTLVFELNSAALTRAARARLDALVPLANAAGRVRVVGYTDDLGSQGLNTRLSDQRALAVMLYLRDRLAEPRPDLSATGRPLCCYVTDNRSEDHRAPNRRAEIALELLDTPAVRTLLLSARAQMLGAKAPPPQGPPSQDAVTAAQLSAQVASEPTTQVASRNAAPAKAVEP